MRLEPVYLVAPKPKPPSVPTRRAFLLAGGTLFVGLGLGGACGYAAGSGVLSELEPTGNAELDELRRLAVRAPIEELMDQAMLFLDLLRNNYPEDPFLWQGAKRIGEELLDNPAAANRRAKALWLRQLIDRVGHCPDGLRALAPELARIR
ncbi:MAG TPA: hypothetical protein ENI87_02985 [bacterium]|nr:hypothetical protein [bacterium]